VSSKPAAAQIAKALGVPLAYLYCDEDEVATLLKELSTRSAVERKALVVQWLRSMR